MRSLSVRALGLTMAQENVQLSLFEEDVKTQKRNDLEQTIDSIRSRYGYFSIQRGIMLTDPKLNLDAKREHTIHPVGFLR